MQAHSVRRGFAGLWRLMLPLLLVPALAGCITVGKEFSQDAVFLLMVLETNYTVRLLHHRFV